MSSPAVADALAEISRRVEGELRADRASRILYSTDASIYRVEPHAVLIPRTVEDLHAAVEVAAERGLPVLPRGAGSSLAGQAVNRALVIDTSRHLDRLLAVDREARTATVEPGIVLDELNRRLKPTGLMFGPDPASSDRAALGGMVSNNSTGAHSILYGMTADHVLETAAVLADGSTARFGPVDDEEVARRSRLAGAEGRIYRRIARLVGDAANRRVIVAGTPRHWRRSGGYNLDRFVDGASFAGRREPRFNLARLLTGAEGTLAAITEITVSLVPRPRAAVLALVQFDRLYDALTAVPAILDVGPSAVELLDRMALTLCRCVPRYARLLDGFLEGNPDSVLITELQGSTELELRSKLELLNRRLRREWAGASAVVPVLDPARQNDVWTVRKAGLGLLMSRKGDRKPIPFIEDAAVPPEHLADYIGRIESFLAERDTEVAYYGHASAGCVHVRPLIDTKRASEVAKLPEIAAFAAELLGDYGGALSSEHGDGRCRSWLNERFFGPDLYALYREVKRAFDPENLFNPGNVVEAPAIGDNLRFGPGYRAVPYRPHLDFRADLGFDRAVEMCNGAGVCRKLTTGTMCPSFMVTREEEHSTRGRANLLRAALSGALPAAELTGERIHQALELCVECKACKAECPSSVDMAKLKVEFLAGYNAVHGVPLRARLFAGAPAAARWASGFAAPAANGLLAMPTVRRLLDRALGITPRRPLPGYARRTFTDWFAARRDRPAAGGERVALFHDTWSTFHHPRVAVAATRLLEAAGFEVVLPGHRCCGRPLISKGLVDEARQAARETVERLLPLAEAGLPIVGLEPSCLLTLRDEYLYLLPGDPRVQLVAERAVTLEELVAERADAGRLKLEWTDAERRVLLHGHCHQKALVGSGPARRALSLPPNYAVAEVDSGCCGMAGSFGYESEHYELSMAMAERRLLPAVRGEEPSTLVVAAGTSCRSQIEHGAGRRALHPAEALWGALSSRDSYANRSSLSSG